MYLKIIKKVIFKDKLKIDRLEIVIVILIVVLKLITINKNIKESQIYIAR